MSFMCLLIDVLNVSVLKDCDEGKDCVEHGARVGDEHLLFVHGEGGHEQLGGRQSAPDNHHASAQRSQNA